MTTVQAISVFATSAGAIIGMSAGAALKTRNPSLHRKIAIAAGLIFLSAFLFTGWALVTTR